MAFECLQAFCSHNHRHHRLFWELRRQGAVPEYGNGGDACHAFFCHGGFAHPELAPLEQRFIDGVPRDADALVRVLREVSREGAWPVWLAIVAWPIAARRASGAAATRASTVNKALVAFFTCMIVAIAAISMATNLSRLSR